MRRSLGICLVLLIAAAAGPAVAVVGQAAAPVAVLLFIDGRPNDLVPVDVAELRRFATAQLEDALAGQGLAAVAQPDLDELRLQRRVRNDQTISLDFLQDCQTLLGAGHLMVANLVSQYGQLLLMVRTIECPTGRALAVGLAEIDLSLEIGPRRADGTEVPLDLMWGNRLQALSRRAVAAAAAPILAPPRADDPVRATMLMLPASGVATSADADEAATHIFLQELLLADRWLVIDPALAAATLSAAGLPPVWLGAEARQLLQRRFGAEHVILTELISYDAARTVSTRVVIEDGARESRPQAIRDFLISVRMVNLRQGGLVAVGHRFVNSSRQTGWFGRISRQSLLQQLSTSAQDLWHTFLADLEAS
jgi:hypothetical protein